MLDSPAIDKTYGTSEVWMYMKTFYAQSVNIRLGFITKRQGTGTGQT